MSSDSESDDDFFCSAPTFKNDTRKNKREDRQMFDFLDLSMKKEDERISRNERIAEKRKQGEDGIIKDFPTSSSDHGETASIVSKSPPTELQTLATKKSTKYDDNDPSYWSRIDDIQKNAEDNRMQRDKRQREMNEFIHGYNSEDGYHSSSDRRDNAAIMDAMIAGASSTLGTRHVIFSEARKGVQLSAFPSLNHQNVDEAVAHQNLRNILHDMDKQIPSECSEIWMRSHKFFIQSYRKNLDYGLLNYYLEGHSRTCKNSAPLIIPNQLMSWLVITSCTCEHRLLQSSALSAAVSCLENDIKIVRSLDTTTIDISEKEIGQPLFHLKDFCPFFQAAFGLWSTTESPSRFLIMSRTLGLHTDDTNKSSRLNAAMKLWSLAFERDMVFFEPSYATETEKLHLHATFEPIGVFIASIVRLGIDPFFHSGAKLEETRFKVLNSFFHWFSRNFSALNQQTVNVILKYAADCAVEACSGLSDSLYNDKIDDGDDDRNGWLPLSLVLRSAQFPLSQKSSLLVEFYAYYAIAAIRKSLYEKSDWDEDILEFASKIMGGSELGSATAVPLPFTCLAFSHAALDTMLVFPSVTNDGPRYHCLVELAAICSQVGINLLQRRFDTSNGITQRKIYDDCDEADRLHHHFFETMEASCEVHKKKITFVMSSPHLRRCKELIIILCSFYRALKDDASLVSRKEGSGKKMKVQSELSNHFMKKE